MLASYMASNFLSPNGYVAFTANFNALTPPETKKLVPSNFMELMMTRVVLQEAVNLAASRSYASSMTSSINKDNIEEGVIYFNACVNAVMMGMVNTKYNREQFPKENAKLWLPAEGVAQLLKMWSSGANRPDNGGFVGFRADGNKGKIVFPEYY